MKLLKNYLFIFTVIFFILGMVNILFAWLGLACMLLPFILLVRDSKKTWCQKYCPRASLYTTCGKATSKFSLKTPRFFVSGGMKWIILAYFALSMFIVINSTIKVASGNVPPMLHVRFLIMFRLPFDLPQLIAISGLPQWTYHFGYRFYSLMLTTTILGLIMALVYKPRTWCTVCPVSTLSGIYLNSAKKCPSANTKQTGLL
ncbi:MAG TPA: hypothetical protein DCP97_03860 [Ruminococcaceae bacterium]|nr:hypothetical protein [Oscillospiraceae bacterium]